MAPQITDLARLDAQSHEDGLTFDAPSQATADEQSYLAMAPTLYGDVESLVSTTGTQELAGETNQIPEPASMGLLGAGLFGIGFLRRATAKAVKA